MSGQADQFEELKQFILAAEKFDMMQRLNSDVKTPLVSAQNLLNMLIIMQSPSPMIQKRIDSGELDQTMMLNQITTYITQAFDIIDLYRTALSQGK